MKITVLGETASMEGIRVIRKEVKVYTEYYPLEETEGDYSVSEKRYLPAKSVIDKMTGKTFEGYEFNDYVEVNLNKVLKLDGI
jgi:hypothetical protein